MSEKTIPNAVDPVTTIAADKKPPLVDINRDKYVETRSASGNKSMSNGDQLAILLQGMTVEMLYDVCDKVFRENDFRTKYANLKNDGMRRMNLGNRLRGFINKREKENGSLIADKKDPKKSGIEVITKHVAPHRKAVDEAIKKAETTKANKKAETTKANKKVEKVANTVAKKTAAK